jgi:uncharacterized protein
MGVLQEMDYQRIIDKYYPEGTFRREIYIPHCRAVADLALKIARTHPGLNADLDKVEAMAMLHDIGICFTDAPEIGCFGDLPYLAHGFKGREILEEEGLMEIAPVCERHIGVGITLQDILNRNLPLPMREMTPQTVEEEIVCYADKFFSKSSDDLSRPKRLEKVRKSVGKYGEEKLKILDNMIRRFGLEAVYSDANTNLPSI